MKAIAGINAIKLAETVTSRSIVFELRRKTANEKVERLRMAEPNLFEDLIAKLARFSNDYIQQVKQARPALPDALGDRDQDNWEPLLQVALVAGGHWLDTALKAAIKISGSKQNPISRANELLADIQEIFDIKSVIKISTAELIQFLCEDSEKTWSTYNRGKPLSPRQLSTKLKDYGIASKTIRINNYETAKGFEIEQFKDAFTRYLTDPLDLTSQSNNSLDANDYMADSVTDDFNYVGLKGNSGYGVTNTEGMQNTKVTLQPNNGGACDGVTDKTHISGGNSATKNNIEVMRF
jgi:putative DNA primase/helicase